MAVPLARVTGTVSAGSASATPGVDWIVLTVASSIDPLKVSAASCRMTLSNCWAIITFIESIIPQEMRIRTSARTTPSSV